MVKNKLMDSATESIIQNFSMLFLVPKENVRRQVETAGLESLLQDPINLIKTASQKQKYQAFLKLRQQFQGELTQANINDPKTLAKYSLGAMRDPQSKENFVVIGVNIKNKPVFIESVSLGTINTSIVHPREVFRNAIRNNVVAIFVSHNHPSGDTAPSAEDIQVTKRLVEAGKIIGIPVLDHVIVSSYDVENHFSFKAHGVLEKPTVYNFEKQNEFEME
ncbi:MAG TPA: hypothetical protein GXZ74_05150 [Tissierellia bacterium]|nr:hypothetical protein [Tissierellia bacterium]